MMNTKGIVLCKGAIIKVAPSYVTLQGLLEMQLVFPVLDPLAVAVDATPMRRECEVMLAAPPDVLLMMLLMSDLVRNVVSLNVNRGPALVGWA